MMGKELNETQHFVFFPVRLQKHKTLLDTVEPAFTEQLVVKT